MAHGFQEYFFERIPAVRETAHLEILAPHQPPDNVELDAGLQNDAPAAAALGDAFSTVLAKGGGKVRVIAGYLQLDEPAVGPALLFQIRVMDDAAVLENDHFVADLLHVAQQMRTEQHA